MHKSDEKINRLSRSQVVEHKPGHHSHRSRTCVRDEDIVSNSIRIHKSFYEKR